MSAIQPTALPLFYKRIVGLNPALHGQLRLDRAAAGYGFAAKAQSVPLGLGEFNLASQHYPIVFSGGPNPVPLALMGLAEGGNLFVGADGRWRPDGYVPAYVRAYPFIFVEDDATRNLFIAMEPDADCIRPDTGQRLFEDSQPTQALNEAIAFCSAYRDNALAAAAFGRALDAAGVLREEEATISFTGGGGAKVRGFRMVKPELLEEVPDETFLEWRRRGWLVMVYAHLHAAGRWNRLIELAAPPKPVTH